MAEKTLQESPTRSKPHLFLSCQPVSSHSVASICGPVLPSEVMCFLVPNIWVPCCLRRPHGGMVAPGMLEVAAVACAHFGFEFACWDG